MKATRKIEYTEKRIKKASEKEVAENKLAACKNRLKAKKVVYVKVDAKTWKEVKQ